MRIYVGTSGYSYDQWKGHFYPEDLASSKMLAYYASQLETVEINNSFYRMPTAKTVEGWGSQVGDGFRFSLKAPQRITHRKAFTESADSVSFFFESAALLGPKLGPVLFQFPPWLQKELDKLKAFLALMPKDRRIAMEFRHASWFAEDTYDVLRQAGVSLVVSETDEASAPLVQAGAFGYLRLRKTEYREGEIEAWAQRIQAQPWQEAYVFFKHEDEGKGPAFARQLVGCVATSGAAPPNGTAAP
jgi:uncharacterized protein YecE (DUF72 family)